jgi:hypothetical protein
MSNLRHLSIRNNSIYYLPSWITRLKRLEDIDARSTFCENFRKLFTTPYLLELPEQQRIPRLTDLAASKIRDFIDKGGDWTDLQDLPSHLMAKITSAYNFRSKEVQILRFSNQFQFVVARINEDKLKGTRWCFCRGDL